MDNFDRIDKVFPKHAEDHELIERAIGKCRAMDDLKRAFQIPDYLSDIEQARFRDIERYERIKRELSCGRAMDDVKRALQSDYLSAIDQLRFKDVEYRHSIEQSLCEIRAMNGLRNAFESLSAESHIKSAIHQISATIRGVQEIIREQSAIFKGLSSGIASMDPIKFSMPQFSQAEMVWNAASVRLIDRMNEVGLLAQRESLATRLFEAAPNAYTTFVQNTVKQLASATVPEIASQLRGSLNLAEYQLFGITDVISAFVDVPDDDDEPDAIRILDAPFNQQDELLSCESIEDENDIVLLTAISPTAQTVERSRRILELVTQCNESGKTSSFGIEIFKPTTRLMTVFSDLPWISATDKYRLGDVVDCLYFIFYESAGKDNLRFLNKCGGPLSEADCDLIWCIKHLRNKWLRHDADHGKDKEILKSWKDLSKKFQWLGLAEHPTNTSHFQQLHYKLLELAEEFLLTILNKLKLKQ